jgi:hypothetical protein
MRRAAGDRLLNYPAAPTKRQRGNCGRNFIIIVLLSVVQPAHFRLSLCTVLSSMPPSSVFGSTRRSSRVFVPASPSSRPSISPRLRLVASLPPRSLLQYLRIPWAMLSCPSMGRHLRVSSFVLALLGVPRPRSSWLYRLCSRVCRALDPRGSCPSFGDVLAKRLSLGDVLVKCHNLILSSVRPWPRLSFYSPSVVLSTSSPRHALSVVFGCRPHLSVSASRWSRQSLPSPSPSLVLFVDTPSHLASCRRNLAFPSHRYLRLFLSLALTKDRKKERR